MPRKAHESRSTDGDVPYRSVPAAECGLAERQSESVSTADTPCRIEGGSNPSDSLPPFTSGCTDADFPEWWERFGEALVLDYLVNAETLALAAFCAGKARGLVPPAVPEPSDRPQTYWQAALNLVCDELLKLAAAEFEGRRDKLVSVIRNAAASIAEPSDRLLDEALSEAQRVLRDGYHDHLSAAIAEARNRFTLVRSAGPRVRPSTEKK